MTRALRRNPRVALVVAAAALALVLAVLAVLAWRRREGLRNKRRRPKRPKLPKRGKRPKRPKALPCLVELPPVPGLVKPELPPDHLVVGVDRATIVGIEEYLKQKIAYHAEAYPYLPQRDGFLLNPDPSVIKVRAATEAEKPILGYLQHQCEALLCAVKEHMSDSPVVARLENNFSKMLVAIDSTTNLGTMWTRTGADGSSVMALNVRNPVAKMYNVIAHEMAHCALSRSNLTADELAGLPGVHGPTHTILWKQFVKLGCEHLGWEFVDFLYPNTCWNYNICDLTEFDPTKVYSTPGPVSGTTFKAWAK